jgi:hypothetical protein
MTLGGFALKHAGHTDQPAHPLSDDQARAQVIDAARDIVHLNNLPGMNAAFNFSPCGDDTGGSRKSGVVEIRFQLPTDTSKEYPADVDANSYYEQIAQIIGQPTDSGKGYPADPAASYYKQIAHTMVTHGWSDGPPGLRPYDRVIYNNGVMAIIQLGPNPGWNMIQLSGECRNMTDHRNDPTSWTDVTNQLTVKSPPS